MGSGVYWLKLHDALATNNEFVYWEGNNSDSTYTPKNALGVAGGLNQDLVFRLNGTSAAAVPIPPAIYLFAPGLAGLVMARRRFRYYQ